MTHPKIIGLTDKAFRLWVWGLSYCQQHLTDGVIPVVAVPGRLSKAVACLMEASLWSLVESGYTVHDYLDWNDSRERVRERQLGAKRRIEDWRDKRASDRNASVTHQLKRVTHATDATLLKPNLTKPNQVQNEEECAEASSAPPFLTFPVVGPKGPEWALSEKRIGEWEGLFPNVDVRASCRAARAWIGANPKKWKTASGMPSFLVRWISRDNDSTRRNGQPAQANEGTSRQTQRLLGVIAHARDTR